MIWIAWEYLLDRLVASDPSRREVPEWPPHPDRVFMALVASWGETGCDQGEQSALDWLSAQGAPRILAPDLKEPDRLAEAPTAFVPVNDASYSSNKSNPLLRDLPIGRNRQPRSFARLPVHGACALCWPEANPEEAARHLPAIRSLCLATASLGHSSSMVRMWADSGEPHLGDQPIIRYEPSASGGDLHLRIPGNGRLGSLVESYADGGEAWERPTPSLWQAYARVAASDSAAPPQGAFSERLVILAAVGANARRFGATDAPALCDALRKTVMESAPDGSRVLELVSGHASGSGDALKEAHCAFVGLPFVGSPHADGHLLGMAMVLPRHLSQAEQDGCIGALARCLDRDTKRLKLRLGRSGTLDLEAVAPTEARKTLLPSSWCPPEGSASWATATPIVLDRMPPRRAKDLDAFVEEVVAEACVRIGLPRPIGVETREASRLVGAPHARQFPPMKRKKDGSNRWSLHALVVWDRPVRGPILLGAGRFRGMGLLKPFREGER